MRQIDCGRPGTADRKGGPAVSCSEGISAEASRLQRPHDLSINLITLQVTVISRGRPADLPEGEEAGCTFRHVDGSTTMASSYANAGLATADAVIIGAARLPAASIFPWLQLLTRLLTLLTAVQAVTW